MKKKELQIINASLILFSEKGFHGTSTAEIAKSAQVATGTLFHYFKSKESLINMVYLYSKECMFEEISGHYNSKLSFKDNVKSLWMILVGFGISKSEMFQFMLSFHCSPYITSLTKKEIESKSEMILEAYMVGLENKKIKNVSYELIMDFLWGSVVATVNHLDSHPEKMSEETKEMAFELFWDGISK